MRIPVALSFAFLVLHLAIVIWDFVAFTSGRPRDTVSWVIRAMTDGNPLIVLAIGIILGHLFGPVRDYPSPIEQSSRFASAGAVAGDAGMPLHGVTSLAPWAPVLILGWVAGWFVLWRRINGRSH